MTRPREPTGLFAGYASLFGVPDIARDVVMPGAFAASLARRGAAGVRLLWQHDPAEPIGAWLELAEDPRGLRAVGRLNLAVARARELAALLGEGGVDGLSIGFKAERARPEPTGRGRRLERVDLWEISLVTFPMHPQARVFAVGGAPASSPAADGVGRRGSTTLPGRAAAPSPLLTRSTTCTIPPRSPR